MAKYNLPDLPYDFGALEPHISAKIMQLHHDKHHKAYVDGANKALVDIEEARSREDLAGRLPHLERALAFHTSGHVLHSLFWQNMMPKGGGQPDGELADAIKRDFGSFDGFKKQMTTAAATLMGSGWAALSWEPVMQRLITTQIYDHQSNVTQGGIPLMVLDGWEHAFYLQYGPVKADYFNAIWNVWNWEDVKERWQAVKGLNLHLRKATI
jgi:Fe-Mn family superoxide dismutase